MGFRGVEVQGLGFGIYGERWGLGGTAFIRTRDFRVQGGPGFGILFGFGVFWV